MLNASRDMQQHAVKTDVIENYFKKPQFTYRYKRLRYNPLLYRDCSRLTQSKRTIEALKYNKSNIPFLTIKTLFHYQDKS